MADLSSEIAGLSPEELELLLRRLRRSGRKEGSAPAPIPRRPAGPCPVSFAQQRLWFLHQLGTGSSAYHIPIVLELRGPVRPDLLAEAFREVGRRHEALRTTFALVGGRPFQAIASEPDFELPEVDLSGLAEAAREAELAALAAREAHRPFDLERGPLLRGLAVRAGAGRVRLLLGLHHIAADNWSAGLLMREVFEAFNALAAGRRPAWPPLPVQYADYAVWQREGLQGPVLDQQLAFWRHQLDGAPPRLDLPADRPRPEVPSFRYGRFVFRLPAPLADAVRALGRRHDATLYMVLLAAWSALLHRFGGHEDVVVGSPVANRRRAELEGIIGFFVNTLLMRSRPRPALAFSGLLAELREAALGAYAHQDLPFERIVEELRPERDTSYQPLFQVMFNVYDGALPELRFAGLEVAGVDVQIGTWNDLDLLLVETPQGLEGYLRYSLDLFEPATAELLAAAYREVLEQVVRAPEARLAELRLPAELVARAEAARRRERKALLAVAATFTADPIAEPLAFWMRQLDLPARVEIAPYHQVFQQLLDPGSLLAGNRDGVNLVLARFEDWFRYQGGDEEEPEGHEGAGPSPEVLERPETRAQAERNARDLAAALRQAAGRSSIPWLLCLCPPSPAAAAAPAFAALSARLAEELARGLAAVPNVYLVGEEERAALYPVEGLHDAYADAAGHVPYSGLGFAALATLLARKVHALSAPPVKVIVLDCDNTLWGGVCGEDGPHGVRLDPAYRRLQERVAAHQRDGVLLCLCSKNEEADVWSVFDQRGDFPLRREHLAAWRINWRPKSENLRELAAELDLGLDSFVLIDDNPVECAEVRAGCPGVLVLPLPEDPERIPHVLEHFWALDRLRVTAEDRRRTALYREAAERERFRKEAAGFQDFLAGLELHVDREELRPDGAAETLVRAAQLTQRINQFNTTTRRRSEGELRGLLADGGLSGWAVRVRDRFGDYGLVGVALFGPAATALRVDSLLLSCRVLGRGVEHRLLADLGEEAARRGLARLDVEFAPTDRNRPALDFLEGLGAVREPAGEGAVFRLATEAARAVALAPAGAAGAPAAEAEEEARADAGREAAWTAREQRLRRIAELADPREVLRRVEAERRRGPREAGQGFEEPGTPVERKLAAVFAQVLGVERVGRRDSFFELGGHSLLGVELFSRVREAFGAELPLGTLFEAPDVARLAPLLPEELPDAQAAGAGRDEALLRLPEIVPDPERADEPFPLTDVQQAYWVGRSGTLDLGQVSCHVYNEMEFSGLDLGRFEAAWRKLIARHGTLRAVFLPDGRQRILPEVPPYEIRTLDLRTSAPGEAEAALAGVRAEMSHQVLPADRWPLFELRASLLPAGRIRVHFSFDLLIADAWSFQILQRELHWYYFQPDAADTELPPLALSFRDYVMALGDLESSPVYLRAKEYWTRRLPDLPPTPELPLAKAPSAVAGGQFVRRAGRLEQPEWSRLQQRARRAGLTPSAVLLTAYAEVLATWSRRRRLSLVLTLFNRLPLHPQVNGLVGDFTSLTLLEADLSAPGGGFAADARRLQARLWEDLDHRHYSSVRVLRDLIQTQGWSSGAALPVVFTSTLAVHGVAGETAEANAVGVPPAEPGLEMDWVYFITQTPQVLLDQQVSEDETGALSYVWDAVEELFPPGLLDDMFGAYSRLLGWLVSEAPETAEASVWESPVPCLVPAGQLAERAAVNATAAPLAEQLLHDGFLEQARRTPDRVAVLAPGRELTYGELHRLSERIARRLRELGAGRERLVAVVLEKGWEQVAAVLGVLGAQAAYLPVDPDLPAERLAYILEQGGAESAVTRADLDAALVWPASVRRLVIDRDADWETGGAVPEAAPQSWEDLAYVIFTSGSTGRPKGVSIDHRGAVNTLVDLNHRFAVGPEDRVLALSALNFDLSVYDIFGLLAAGGAVVVPDPDLRQDPAHWLDLLVRHRVTVWNTVPALAQMLVDAAEGRPGALPASLRLVMMSGDWIPVSLPDRLRALLPGVQVMSLGGATEASIWSIHYPIGRVDPSWRSIPYGRPLLNQSFQVLDGRMQPRPVWVPGDLYIGGIGLARDYWRDEEKTRESFVRYPATGERLYRTGDLGRYLPGGDIEFLGREDAQVKVQGYRIELEEIEAHLLRHPAVREAVVVALGSREGEKRLVGYVVANVGSMGSVGSAEPSDADLRAFLGARLPSYMVPSAWVRLPELPFTANGKVDRRRLPEPAVAAAAPREAERAAPRTPIEELLVGLWAQVLGADRVGVDDSLFELGAHSLLATQLISRVRRAFDLELPLRTLFEAPTPALLAAEIERERARGAGRPAAAIPRLERRPGERLPLSFAQQRIWFFDRWEPGSAVFNLSTAVHLAGPLRLPVLAASVREIVRRHETLRSRFLDVAGEPAQVVDPPAPLDFTLVDLAGLTAAARAAESGRLTEEESVRPFDLERGPLLRAALLRLGDAEHLALLTMHHIVSDGWSMGILIQEIGALYGALAAGRPSPFPELPIQYGDFAAWQRGWLQGEVLARELEHWRGRLADAPESLDLPVDRPRGAVQRFRGGRRPFTLPADFAGRLRALGRGAEATMFMVLLAAFKALLLRYTHQPDLVVGTLIANRNRREVEGLIGCFANTLVLRDFLPGEASFRVALAGLRDGTLDAYAHQDFPFEKLVEELNPERQLSLTPLFQVMFVLQNTPTAALELPGLELAARELERGTVNYDLFFMLDERDVGIAGRLDFDVDLFDGATVERLLRHFEAVLAAVAADPDVRLADLPLLGEAERHQSLVEWNDSAWRREGAAEGILDGLAKQVALRPEATAVVYGAERLSYAELAARVDRGARALAARGVGRGSLVALLTERGPDLLAAVLAAFRCGAAYLPLDPHHPPRRLAQVIGRSGSCLVLASAPLAPLAAQALESLSADAPALGGLADLFAEPLAGAPEPAAAAPEDLAYVIYTSGSTGLPKGVMVEHRGMVNHLWAKIEELGLTAADKVAQNASQCFDISVWQLLAALMVGGEVHILPDEVAHDPWRLLCETEGAGITILETVPSLLRLMVEEVEGQGAARPALARLRWMIPTGEALPASLSRRWLALYPAIPLLNAYGPTECSDDVSHGPLASAAAVAAGPVAPIGRPVINTRLHLLAPWLRPVPVGVAGELCVGGDGVGRGYLGDGPRTARAFVPDPFAARPGARLYRTGDLARFLADGRIEFLGRLDHQVKVRGFRIELGEIEAVLRAHPAVREAVVVARREEGAGDDLRLVGYVEPDPEFRGEAVPSAAAASPDGAGGLQTEQVSQWAAVFDDFYAAEALPEDPTFNTAAWVSSYTGGRIPDPEMREWLADTVERIRGLGAARLLELGCGTGMLLFRLAPGCVRYLGTDIAAEGLAYLRRQLDERGGLPQAELLHRPADDFTGIAPDSFDGVVVNSVVQYFPSIDYLARVLEGAVEAVAPGGSIVFGDIRSLPLLEAFHTSVELARSEPSLSAAELRQRVRARLRQETELVIDPDFFFALPQHLPKIGRVEIHPKRGSAHNELTCFRYQVVLHVGPPPAVPAPAWADWQAEGWSLESLRRALAGGAADVLHLANIPNARVAPAAAAARRLGEDESLATVAELRRAVAEAGAGAVDPQDLWNLAAEAGWEADLGWSRPGPEGRFEAVLRRPGVSAGRLEIPPAFAEAPPLQRFSRYANQPLQGKFASRVAPLLRAFLAERLPEYMVPPALVALDALPLTPNGKIDYRALPAPEALRADGEAFLPPRTETERRLAEIWSEVLGVRRIGARDDFFAIGGHSLLATQVSSRVRVVFGADLPLRDLFEAHTLEALAARIELAAAAVCDLRSIPIPRAPRDEAPVLSFAQERLWFLDQLEPGDSVYNLPSAVRCVGEVRVPVLERTYAEIVRRHETLRTTFPALDGRPWPVVGEPAPQTVPLVDLAGLPAAWREREARRLMREEAHRPFDLARGPLLRVGLVRLNGGEHLLLSTLHHIAADAWSMGVFVQEVAALYGTFAQGLASPLPAPPIQYRDYALWQRRALSGERLQGLLAHWRGKLEDAREVLALPTDRPRPPVQTARGGLRTVELPGELTAALQALGQRENATLFMTLLTGFNALLYRYTGQEDLSVGTLIANRDRLEVERLIGCFINTLVLRHRLAGGNPFRGELARVREVTLDAYANPDLPFEKLVEELRPERDLSHPPLCQVLFVFQNAPRQALELPGLTLSFVAPDHAASPFDMAWYFEERDGVLSGTAEYNLDLLDGATVQRMMGQLGVLLAGAAQDPERALDELPLLSAPERAQVTWEWNDTAAAFPGDRLLPERIREVAAARPDAPAAWHRGVALTYGELQRRADRLARSLRHLGVGPDVLVGLCVERSLDLVVGIAGVLAAGGAYLPLDPAYPKDRLAYYLRDSGAPLVLTGRRDPGLRVAGPRFLPLAEAEDLGGEELAPSPAAGPENLAYVIYTSGSTGEPKGVAVTHRNLAHSTAARESYYREPVADYLLASSFAFDSSVAGIFWTLGTGGALVLPDDDPHLDLPGFLALFDRCRISHLLCLPALYRALLEADSEGRLAALAALSAVIVAGEACPRDLIDLHRARFGGPGHTGLFNEYGPTEATVWSTVFDVLGRTFAGPVPIGQPIDRGRVHVLDRHLRPVPAGVFGEVYLGGDGLARGYLGKPAATAERFLPDPSAAAPGERLYRTGDLARWLPTGDLEFAGRADQQVKVRGFRIELGEIERVLDGHPQVAESVAVAREGEAVTRLAAYVAAAPDGAAPRPEALRAYLQGKLPEYMIPSSLVVLDRLPRTPNGKVDRRALPAPGERRPDLRVPFRAPLTPAEEALADIWRETLRIDRVGADDPFLELGGDSILGLQVVSRANRAGYRFLLKDLFEQGTVARLAAVARVVLAADGEAPRPAVPSTATAESYPLTPMQQGILFHSLYAPEADDYLVETVLGVDAGGDVGGGDLDLAVLERAWRRLVARHPALRTVFRWEGLDRPLQVVLPEEEAGAAVHRHDLSGFSPEAAEARFERWLERDRRPDLVAGPLAWLAAFRFPAGAHRLVFGYHHLVLDGWSTALVVRELAALYAAGLEGRDVELPELPEPLPYADYVAWLEAQSLVPAQGYWRERLAGFPAPTILGCDRAPGRQAGEESDPAERRLDLSGEEAAALERAARGERLTLNTLVQGCWAALLGAYGGSADVVFGVTVAGRPPELPGAETVVGLCINTLPLRAQLDGGAPAADWLRRLQERQAEDQAWQHAPLAQVQKWSEVPAGSPLFEVLYVFGNFSAAVEGPAGPVDFSLLRAVDRTHYPLTLEVEPGARLGLRLVHDRTRFADVDAVRLLDALRRLLLAVAADPLRPLADLPYLSRAERQQVLIEWNDSAAPSATAGVVERIEAQARRTPDALAAVCGGESLSYSGLLDRADRLASRLSGLGAGPETVVALLAHRGLDLLTAILASFRAGAAYLPLDPHHPAERTAQILDRSGAPLVVASRELLPLLSPSESRRLACLEDLLGEEPADGARVPAVPVEGSHLAYVIYTSGSTGVPKGAMVEHRGMLNHLDAKIEDLGLAAGDRVAQTASQCFDISVWQFLAALVVGGIVHIFPDEVVHDPARLLAEVDRHGVTVLETVPSLLRLMLDEVESGAQPALAALRWMIPTGEALPPESCRRWLALYPGVPLLNAYGPTECSDDVTHRTVHAPPPVAAAQVPIGRAVRNTRLLVLGADLRPVPAGVAGELYVGGDGVGRGYLADPARTALAFVPDPTGLAPGARLYRTGDRARHLADGNLDFLGRVDYQVKIRGFRIELGEIEAALSRVPGVRQAVVVDVEAGPGDRRLAAYVVAAGRPVPSPELLRDSLRERLPDYMVPSAFVLLDALPLTRNGKVDRRALPAPSVAAAGRAAAPAAARSEVERAIAAVWAEVLGLPEVGVEDNFFDLGGHSLLLVQVLSRLRKAFDAELAMVDLFRRPTVSGLAAHLARQREAGDGLEERYSRADQRRQASGRRRQFVQGRLGQRDKELADVTS